MEGSDVVGATGGTVGVIGGAAEIASGMGIGGAEVGNVGASGAEVGDVGASGIVFVGSSPCSVGTGVDYVCSVCGDSGGATMGWALGGAK